jgi:hypothetical protein
MSSLPELIRADDFPGEDSAARWKNYIEDIYQRYLRTVAWGGLVFRGCKVNCQFRPETEGKHYAFWHMMQEGSGGRSENDRTPDPDRCHRVEWISWVIQNGNNGSTQVRVFTQAPRKGETSWVLWLHENRYAVVLWERNNYFLLKTAFMVKPHKAKEFERDWNLFQRQNG